MTDSVPVALPSFDDAEIRLVTEVIRSGWVTQGPRVAEFERRFAAYVGANEAVAVTSGTTALFLALHAAGVGAGDEVIVPSLSFIATANAVVHVGATPVFVDVDPATSNIDPERIRQALSPRTRAILPVDQLGMPADMDRILEIASEYGLFVLEDAACAIGSRYLGEPVGTRANAACFSFHPRKVLVTGEGGMITTNDEDLAARLRLLRHQGMSVSDLERHEADRVIIEDYPVIGYNFRLSDLHAALGIVQLGKLDGFLSRRKEIAARYESALGDQQDVHLPQPPPGFEPNYQSYLVRLSYDRPTRDTLLDELQRRGVSARRGLMAIHREPCYRDARRGGSLEHTELLADQTLLLPMYVDLTTEDQDHVVEQLRAALDTVLGNGKAHRPESSQ